MKTVTFQKFSRLTATKRWLIKNSGINGVSLALLLFVPGGFGAFADSSVDNCAIGRSSTGTSQDQRNNSRALLNAESIKILSWNIKKGQESKWDRDLRKLSYDKDLVFLQEASLTKNFYDAMGESKIHNVAQGWKSSGVLTAALVEQVNQCKLVHTEPILRTPKATLLNEFQIRGTNQTLLTVNVHMVNFSIGTTEFRNQLKDINEIVARHSGPVILSGDFNTWRSRRLELLRNVAENLGLSPVSFAEDNRSRMFGFPLDHTFIRGLRMVSSKIEVVQSSDHNALSVELTVYRNYATKGHFSSNVSSANVGSDRIESRTSGIPRKSGGEI